VNDTHDVVACEALPHPCFGCKMRLWREGRAAGGVCPPASERDWNGPTINERLEDMHARAKVNGYDPQYAGRAVLV
jgi:hypothetical protein